MRLGESHEKSTNPHIPSHPSPKRIMKKQYMKVKQSKKNYSTTLFTAEANVDMGIESTRPNVEVKGVEIIDGKKFLVLKV